MRFPTISGDGRVDEMRAIISEALINMETAIQDIEATKRRLSERLERLGYRPNGLQP
jgi:hypothetical protein